MRLLLLIPALLLFFANVSFVKKMPAAEMKAKAKKEGCCKKQKAMHKGCSGESAAWQDEDAEASAKQCQKESTCLCICVFQFAAPAQSLPEFNFTSQSNTVTHFSTHEYYWKNPYIAVPWQPPDFI